MTPTEQNFNSESAYGDDTGNGTDETDGSDDAVRKGPQKNVLLQHAYHHAYFPHIANRGFRSELIIVMRRRETSLVIS